MPETSRVIILGAGFGGLAAARALRRAPVAVTIIDRCNYHLFQPLLYQVATASLSPADIACPIRTIFRRQRNVEVILGEVTGIDLAARELHLADGGAYGYDQLILATGSTHHYFGHDEWAAAAPGLKTIPDAISLRARFLRAFERAERETDPAERKRLLTFLVVGAGPTGCELAGTMAEIAKRLLPRDFRRIDPAQARIILVEHGPRILAHLPPALSASAQRQLERLGVQVWCDSPVTGIEPGAVRLGSERVDAGNVCWAAGVKASPLGALLGVELDRTGRVPVAPDLSLPGRPEVAVIGDLAAVTDPTGRPVPGVAPAAKQMGAYVGRRLAARLAGLGGAARPFVYRDKGSLAVIGRGCAVGTVGRVKLTGFPAWLAWLGIHIWYLVGFRNRILVLLAWGWSYLDFYRGARLITVDDDGRPAAG